MHVHMKFFTEVIFGGSMHMPINCADRAIVFHHCTSRSIFKYVRYQYLDTWTA